MTALSQFTTGFRLFTGESLNALVNAINNLTGNGTAGAVAASNFTQSGVTSLTKVQPQLVATAGTTQLDATAITGSKAIITVALTASTHGVRLPAASTGLEVLIANAGAFGCKVYPAVNGKLGASSTNSAIVLAINKANRYIAVNTTRWILQVGG